MYGFEPELPAALEQQGVTQETFNKLLKWGWVTIAGSSLDWAYWNEEKARRIGASHAGRSR